MISLEKPDPADLLHYGVKGMRWGHRKEEASGSSSKKSKAKKVALIAGTGAAVAGAAFVGYKLTQSGGSPLSSAAKGVQVTNEMTKIYKNAGMSAAQIAEAQRLAAAWA